MWEEDQFTFRVIDLKQYVYCPRILYYQTVLPQIRPLTYKMEAGIKAHEAVEGREKRRSLRTYGLAAGERYFNVSLYNPELGLSGEVDMVIETEQELIPVDYKNAKREGPHFRLQLAAYGRMLSMADPKSELSVKRGFIYLIPKRQAIEVKLTLHRWRQIDAALKTMTTISQQQQLPAPTSKRGRCVDCEFRRFCNDVL